MKIKRQLTENVVDVVLYSILLIIGFITIYPMLYIFSMSISDPIHAASNNVLVFPKGFSTAAYGLVLESGNLWKSYYNTIWYTTVGTIFNIIMTMTTAYAVSRKKFFIRNQIMILIVITMFFSGGMIPQYILINKLGIYNTRWAMILPTAVGAWYIIITRTFIQSTVPESIFESAYIDGANDLKILYSMVLPLSKPIIAVLGLFYSVGHWNSYFNALLYLSSANLQPLQIFLRKILIDDNAELAGGMAEGLQRSIIVQQTKYAAVIVVMLPILFVYPFAQKHFVKGMMVGSIK